jgi:hypothetical protein
MNVYDRDGFAFDSATPELKRMLDQERRQNNEPAMVKAIEREIMARDDWKWEGKRTKANTPQRLDEALVDKVRKYSPGSEVYASGEDSDTVDLSGYTFKQLLEMREALRRNDDPIMRKAIEAEIANRQQSQAKDSKPKGTNVKDLSPQRKAYLKRVFEAVLTKGEVARIAMDASDEEIENFLKSELSPEAYDKYCRMIMEGEDDSETEQEHEDNQEAIRETNPPIEGRDDFADTEELEQENMGSDDPEPFAGMPNKGGITGRGIGGHYGMDAARIVAEPSPNDVVGDKPWHTREYFARKRAQARESKADKLAMDAVNKKAGKPIAMDSAARREIRASYNTRFPHAGKIRQGY